MKLFVKVVAFVGIALMGALSASAQVPDKTIKVNVPFQFVFVNKTFPAGQYRIVRDRPNVLVLRDSEGHPVAMALTRNVEARRPTGQAVLRFYNVDGKQVLMQVWQQDAIIGNELFRPKAATALARQNVNSVQASAGAQP